MSLGNQLSKVFFFSLGVGYLTMVVREEMLQLQVSRH